MSYFPGTLIIDEQTISVQELLESHGFELALTQTGDSNDKLFDINRANPALQISSQSLGLGLAGYDALLEDSRGDVNSLENLVEEL